jgi:hypothetical protein
MTPITNPAKKHPQISSTKIHKKPPKITKKGKTRSTSKLQRGTRMSSKPSIHHEESFFIKRLASPHHPTHLKICLEALASPRSEEERRKNKGANEPRFKELVVILSLYQVYMEATERLKYP